MKTQPQEEVTREQIPIQTPDASSGTTTHEKVSVKANLNGISQTVNRLPNGHYSTLRCISKVFHSIVKDPQNCITSSQIADYLAFELCKFCLLSRVDLWLTIEEI